MARPFEPVSCLNDSKKLWKIAIRVLHRWSVTHGKKEHFKAVVSDKMGCDIHVVIPSTYTAAFNKVFTVGHTCTICNFKVVPNDVLFKPSSHKYAIRFTEGASCSDLDKHDIPPKKYKFASFSDILIGTYQKDMLIDIIGMVESVGYAQPNPGSKKQQVNFVLRDNKNNTLNCTLWEEYASQFNKYNQEKCDESRPPIVLLEYVKVKEEGKYPIAVTNTYNVTKLTMNPEFPFAKEFLMSIPKECLLNSSGHLSSTSNINSHNSDNSHQTPSQKLLSKSIVIPLSEIVILNEVTYCATVATTRKLIPSQYGWYYQACHECPRVAQGKTAPFICESGHSTETSIFRYKIEIEVFHLGVSCKFVFWDKECTELLGVSAAEMRNTMMKAGVTDPLEFPLDLDTMLGLEMAFKVKWQPRWGNCSVVMIVRDKTVINQLKSPWECKTVSKSLENTAPQPSQVLAKGKSEEEKYTSTENPYSPVTVGSKSLENNAPQLSQIKESVDEANSDAVESCEILTEFEITSKHKPEPKTPTPKRKTIGDSVESGSSTQLNDGDWSSTKLKKQIKLEPAD